MNALSSEVAFYATHVGYSASGRGVAPALPWSQSIEAGHVALHVGCDKVPDDPRTFSPGTSCPSGEPQALLLQSEEARGGDCFSVFSDQTGVSPAVWYNFGGACQVPLPSGAPLASAASRNKGPSWYFSF
ncbi:MAG TPA: hypothetical protein VEJ84_06035 [Acidimicrobiales bacterium]|nr:hypothetical protein [Acidimicrobiales bacterium]